MAKLLYREQLPEPSLAPYLECFWSLEARSESTNVILPDGCVDLIYSSALGLIVAGPMTTAQCHSMPGHSQTVGIRFRPAMARAFIGVSPYELRNTNFDAELFWPKRARQTRYQLDNSLTNEDKLGLLRKLLPSALPPLDGLACSLLALSAGKGLLSIDDLARQTNLSPRQFRRRCLTESGYSPKHLSRILRFREARALAIQRNRPNWAQIAVQCGYFDQSHLIRDFSEFAGAAPGMSVLSNL